VAVVRPFTSAVFENNASWENGKWIYTLLQHLHIPVDPLDEGYLMSEDLSQYRVIIVSGSHLRRDTAEKLRAWVYQGGVLITSGGGLARDESDRPLHSLREVLGISERTVPTLWGEVRRYGATTLAPISPVAEPPAGSFVLLEPEGGDFELAIGRERWQPSSDSEALGCYADGGVAILRHRFGRGWAVVFGYYAGLEYAADVMREDFDMARHFAPIKRATMDVVLRQAGVEPPIAISHPLVEGLRLRHPRDGRETILLINWAYRGRELVPLEGIQLAWRGESEVREVWSTWHRNAIRIERVGVTNRLVLSRLEEGDILLVQ
jgi:hypothetical protein